MKQTYLPFLPQLLDIREVHVDILIHVYFPIQNDRCCFSFCICKFVVDVLVGLQIVDIYKPRALEKIPKY